jgi:hypothetical protein
MIANVEPVSGKANVPTYHLSIVLLGMRPPVWRRLQVPGNANLGWLHAVIQVAMGWTNSHLHQFLIDDARYSTPAHYESMVEGEEPARDEARATLAQVAPGKGAQFGYEYDFGDSWEHGITVEKILPPDPATATIALCLDGARACPPEDCGGVGGYADLLRILKNRKHPEHESMKEWLGRPFDAEAFSLAKTNFWLRKVKWPRVTEAQLARVLMGRDGCAE